MSEGRCVTKDKWRPLNRIAQGGDNILENYVIEHVWSDFPGFISVDFFELFKKII